LITLNTERGLVRLETWDEVETIAGYTRNVDPSASTLKSIIGSYRFPDLVVCGLSNCHHKHFRGYIVSIENGQVTNIGHQGGKTHFGVEFEKMSLTFDRDLREKEHRETLQAFKYRIDEYTAEVERLKSDVKGGNWLNKQITNLTRQGRAIPDGVLRVLNEMIRTRSPVLVRRRLATAREIELSNAMRHSPGDKDRIEENKGSQSRPKMVEEDVGFLDGFTVLYPENDIRKLLVLETEIPLRDLAALDINTATRHELNRWAKWTGEVDTRLRQCREIIGHGRDFFRRNNIAKLAEITESDTEENLVMELARAYDK